MRKVIMITLVATLLIGCNTEVEDKPVTEVVEQEIELEEQLVVNAEETTVDQEGNIVINNKYIYNKDTATLVEYIGIDTDVSIPYKFIIDNEVYYVYEIGENAYEDKGIENIIIPEGIVVIGENAFEGNTLRRIKLPRTMEYVGKGAFKRNRLKEIELGNSLIKELSDEMFMENEINVITIPEGIEVIRPYVFKDNPIVEINLPGGIEEVSLEGIREVETVTINRERSNNKKIYDELINIGIDVKYTGDKLEYESNIIVADKLEEITEEYAENIYLNSPKVYRINDTYEFDTESGALVRYLGKDKEIKVPSKFIIDGEEYNVKVIGYAAYMDKGITKVEMHEGLEVIENSSFELNDIEELKIPKTVNRIGKYAFADNKIKKVGFEDGSELIVLGEGALYGNEIENIEIPTRVEILGKDLFKNNGKLKSINIPYNAIVIDDLGAEGIEIRLEKSEELYERDKLITDGI